MQGSDDRKHGSSTSRQMRAICENGERTESRADGEHASSRSSDADTTNIHLKCASYCRVMTHEVSEVVMLTPSANQRAEKSHPVSAPAAISE